MTTSAVSTTSTSASTAQTTSSTTGSNTLGKDDFLKLLTAQLQNQDPLQPVDNQAFIAQLAQFSSLEQMQGISSKLDSLLLAANSSTQLDTASLVGKSVSFRTDGVDVIQGQPPPTLQGTLAAQATVAAIIQDGSGRTVRAVSLGTLGAGAFSLKWDGRDSAGNVVPPGHYTVQAVATAPDGSSPSVTMSASGQVQGIDFSSGSALLVVGGARVQMSDVLQVTQP